MNPPRVLVFSHNAFSKTLNNGKTLNAIFQRWPKSHLAQLFLASDAVDGSICGRFFQILDRDILKKLFFRNKECGRAFTGSRENANQKTSATPPSALYLKAHQFARTHHGNFFYWLRDFIWERGLWKTEALYKWIDEFNPDLLFFVGGNYVFSYQMALHIVETRHIPLVIYLTDDYLTHRFSWDPFYHIQHYLLLHQARKAITSAKLFFVIGEEMATEYNRKFAVQCQPLMNCVPVPKDRKAHTNEAMPLRLVYLGSLHLNRWKSLVLLGRALQAIQSPDGPVATLEIFCGTTPAKPILEKLCLPPAMSFSGSLDAEGVNRALETADILVHVESFDTDSRHLTRYSISTKIPEYLCQRKCILALGPSEVASIKYLGGHDAAHCISSMDQEAITQSLATLLRDKPLRQAYADHAYQLAAQHDQGLVSAMLYEALAGTLRTNAPAGNS